MITNDSLKFYIKIACTCLFISAGCLFDVKCQYQGELAVEICNSPDIRTILLYRAGWELSMPVIIMGEDENLELRFDYLGEPEFDYSYTIQNCTYDWHINNVPEHYYLEGFNEVPIYDYSSSRNTTKYFTHYFISVPTDDLKILTSGNFLIKIYDPADPEKIIFTRKYCIAEKKVGIIARVRHPDFQNQELSVQVQLGDLKLLNPLEEIRLVIIKNYDWNNRVQIKSPPVLRESNLYFDLPFQIITQGGNEFRYFDTKSTKYSSERVNYIEYKAPEFHFFLKPDKLKQYLPYFFYTDLNGRFFVETTGANDRHTESDYVQVHFALESQQPLGSDVYIYGALTNWQTDTNNYMIYNQEKMVYEKTLLLKQGYYNYAYVTRDYNASENSFEITEGSHDETENDYLIFVYLHKTMSNIDRLLGYTIINSTNKTR
jgi:hypothetical protein